MERDCRGVALTLGLLLCLLPQETAGQSRPLALPLEQTRSAVSPLLEDASLHDVTWVGSRLVWAVGDRGAVWRSTDGGQTWRHTPTPVSVPLRSVCFLTDRVGWIVGGGIAPHFRNSTGVVLGTQDGGETWQRIAEHPLPLLRHVQFFDLQEGIAVGESSSRSPAGILRTSDGGITWDAVPGPATEGWQCAAFTEVEVGVVAGAVGRFQSVGGGRLLPALIKPLGLRGMQDLVLRPDLRGWMVGDGALVMTTDNAGVSSCAPDTALPRELRDVLDLRGVTTVGDHVWIVGRPGSVVWHSPDAGGTWEPQPTGHPVPLQAIAFASETRGCAVGALGRILLTDDGGQTWHGVRQPDARLAMLAFHAHATRVSLNLPTKYGAELGYRTAAVVAARRDIGPERDAGRLLSDQLSDALIAAGGVDSDVDWAFPLTAPELSHNQAELVREWQLLTDNRLREVMLSRLVTCIRMWRPDVVLLEEPPADDAATRLLGDALKLALAQSGDEHQQSVLADVLHLEPWHARRVFQRLQTGGQALISLDPFEFLPRQGKSVQMAARDAYSRLPADNVTMGRREAYRPAPAFGPSNAETMPLTDFFAGLALSPGSDARRTLGAINDAELERGQNLAQQQQNFAEYSQRMFDDQRHATQVIAQLQDITGAAPDDQAASQLADLASEYRSRGQWELAAGVLAEVVRRYPRAPATGEAIQWLLPFYTSAEVGWQRLRSSSISERSTITTDRQVITAQLQEAIQRARAGDQSSTSASPSIINQASANAPLRMGGVIDQQDAREQSWADQAEALMKLLKQANPEAFAQPAVQFSLASLQRRRGQPRQSDEILRGFLTAEAGGPWNRLAAGELWLATPEGSLSPHPLTLCRRAAQPPLLDGILGDECWQDADPVVLRSEADASAFGTQDVARDTESHAVARFAWDAGFLYVSARIPREASLPTAPPETAGRIDDANLTGFDRLSFQFDIDRDYRTCYRFDVDQRGWTADACWENDAWNGQRFIAVDGDADAWRIEMAIPINELARQAPRRGETWSIGVVRIMPAVGIESWTHPSGSLPRPEGFGFLRFE